MRELRTQGYEVPKAVPFLDTTITWGGKPFPDLATDAGKKEWVDQYIRFFDQYYSRNADPQADGYLGIMNGRVMLDTWHMNGIINPMSLSRGDVEGRLASQFGAAHPVFTHGVYQIGTAVTGITVERGKLVLALSDRSRADPNGRAISKIARSFNDKGK